MSPQTLLDFDADEDLQRMYALLARIPDGLEPLRRKFEAPFLTETEAYYTAEAAAFLNAGGAEGSGNIPECLKKA